MSMSKNGNSSIRRFVDSSIGRMTGGRGDRATMLTCGRGGRAIPALLLTFSLFTFTFSLSAATRYWTGEGTDALASNAANWLSDKSNSLSTGAPETGDDVVLDDGSVAMTWDAGMKDVKPASWTQDGYTGTVTFETVFDTEGFYFAEITGNVVLNTGTWTHLGNGSTAVNRLYVKCGGDFTLGADGVITADGLGYGPRMNVDSTLLNLHGLPWVNSSQGGSYGGHGGLGGGATTNFTYGCYYAPEDLGNAGRGGDTIIVYGGGAIRIDVTGSFTHNGSISANSYVTTSSHYGGAGGSIFINAGSISGTGTMTADANNTQSPGAGGRIAIILNGYTDETANGFDNYDVLSLVKAVSIKQAADQGGPGTIYCETAADTPREGWLILKGNNFEPTKNRLDHADPFTFEIPSLHFAKLTVTGKIFLRIGGGFTLDISGTELEVASDCGLMLDGGSLTCGAGADWDITCPVRHYSHTSIPTISRISAGGELRDMCDQTWNQNFEVYGVFGVDGCDIVNGNIHVYDGGKITQSTAAASNPSKADLTVNGNVTIDAGGAINVNGRGYQRGYCKYGSVSGGIGGSYAGFAMVNGTGLENVAQPPYGSIKNPVNPGGGGGGYGVEDSGGGALFLTVTGALVVNGVISSDGVNHEYYPGAGGTVNIRTGTLSGSADAVISANAGTINRKDFNSSGSGGRIAIRLTGTDADFSQYLGSITAYGTCAKGTIKPCGGAGTIFLKAAAQGEDEGKLIVANSPTATRTDGGVRTPLAIDDDNPDLAFGDVEIGPNANLALGDGETLTVKGSFTNSGTFTAGTGSTVAFAGAGDATISGSTTFDTVSCTVPGKRLLVADGTTITATTIATVESDDEDHPITMTCATQGGTWTLDTSAGAASFVNVAIGGCQAVATLTVQGGENLGGNSDNVSVITATATTLTWTGAVNDRWSEAGNWSALEGDAHSPMAGDTVIIAAAANQPTLLADSVCAALTVEAGASLDLSDKALTVAGDISVAGTLTSSGSQTITIGGDLAITGTFTCGRSVIVLNGTAVQEVSSASPLYGLTVSGPGADILNSLECSEFTAGGVAQTNLFADGSLFKAIVFKVDGDLTSAPVTLSPKTTNGAWSLLAYANDITGVKVKNCNASAGLPIVPASSQDDGGNVNWLFTDTRTIWDGTTELMDGMDLVVDENITNSISSDVTLNSLELRSGASLTISASVPVAGNVLVGTDATLSWNVPSTIGGRLVVLSGATVTHDANPATSSVEVNKLDLTVTGDGYFASGSKVDVSARGYGSGKGSGTGTSSGASYGGRGYTGTATLAAPCYGSISNPTNYGSGGYNNSTFGGGAIILSFGGLLTLDGDMYANGGASSAYAASGGSINLTAASIAGVGALQARGGTTSQYGYGPGGGRIALKLTGAGSDFSAYTGSVDAFGSYMGAYVYGSAGTIYWKTAADDGRLEIRNSTVTARTDAKDRTDYPSEDFADPEAGRKLAVELSDYATLSLTADADVKSLKFLGTNPRVLLNGHNLHVHSFNPYRKTGYPSGVTIVEDGGSIIWDKPGFVLIVR